LRKSSKANARGGTNGFRTARIPHFRAARNRGGSIGTMERYAFHRKHVKGAESANDILRAAIADPERGRVSDKPDTRLLYSDVDLLKSSLQ